MPVRDPNPADGAIGISSDPQLGTYASDDVPLTIPDHRWKTTTTVASSLTVSDPNTISDLNVELNISHPTNNADLNVYLTSPDGKKVELFSDVGFQQKNFRDTILDDEAGTSIKNGSGSFGGSFKPEGKLSGFDGKDTQGTWELSISDDFHTNTRTSGTLNSWSLITESLNVVTWVPGDDIASQDVYIATNFDDVNDSTDAAYQGNFAADVSSIGIDLDLDTTYFWRIDTLDADGALIRVGDIWSFSTAPDPIFVDPSSDLAAATELAKPGGIIHFAEGMYDITSLIEIKEGVTYQGAGAGLRSCA